MATENDIEVGVKMENSNVNTVNIEPVTPASMSAPVQESTLIPSTLPATVTTVVAATPDDNEIKTTTTITTMHITTSPAPITNGENNGNVEKQQQQETQTDTSSSSKGRMDSDATLANFKVLYVLTQLFGLTLIVLVGSWVGVHMGGFAGTSNPKLEFNWHPLLMTIGLIFLYGNSILVYRGFRTTRKKTLKITHASIHMAAFILTVIALITVFDSHNLAEKPIPNMYSLHSWLGLSAVILFCMQYVAGFMAYMVPGLKENYKIAYMPLHIYFGLFGFVLAIASALMGLTEKAIFSIGDYALLPTSGVMVNMCGVMFVIFGGLVIYLATEPAYKRRPVPEDAVLLTGSQD